MARIRRRRLQVPTLSNDVWEIVFSFFVAGMLFNVRTHVLRTNFDVPLMLERVLVLVRVLVSPEFDIRRHILVCSHWREFLKPLFRAHFAQLHDLMNHRIQFVPLGGGKGNRRVAHRVDDDDDGVYRIHGRTLTMCMSLSVGGKPGTKYDTLFQLESFFNKEDRLYPDKVPLSGGIDWQMLYKHPTPASWGTSGNSEPRVVFYDVRSKKSYPCGDLATGDFETNDRGQLVQQSAKEKEKVLHTVLSNSFDAKTIAFCDETTMPETLLHWIRAMLDEPKSFKARIMKQALKLWYEKWVVEAVQKNGVTEKATKNPFGVWFARRLTIWKSWSI